MTITKAPGVYFEETTTNTPTYNNTTTPLFIIQTNTSIPGVDDQISQFTDFDTFAELAENKGLTKTITYIENTLREAEQSTFYIYNAKTDTPQAFTNILINTANLNEITDIIYIEETKSTSSNKLTDKINAFKTALNSNKKRGVFRELYLIPYGTISNTKQEEGETLEEATIKELDTLTEAGGSGRICIIIPDENAGYVAGKIIKTRYDEEPGFTALNNVNTPITYNWNDTQMLHLTNRGIILLNRENLQGTIQYRIYLGVTTSFKDNNTDGYLTSRRTCDELLRQIKFQADGLIKDKTTTTTLSTLEGIVTSIITEFATEESINQEGTALEINDNGDQTYTITGKITTNKPLVTIEVNTALQ